MKTIAALGDQAALAYFEDERSAIEFARCVRDARPPWLIDVVSSYSSVAVFFDLANTSFSAVAATLRNCDGQGLPPEPMAVRVHIIPCCYELALDLERITEHTGLDAKEIIALHTGQDYTVYPWLGQAFLTWVTCRAARNRWFSRASIGSRQSVLRGDRLGSTRTAPAAGISAERRV